MCESPPENRHLLWANTVEMLNMFFCSRIGHVVPRNIKRIHTHRTALSPLVRQINCTVRGRACKRRAYACMRVRASAHRSCPAYNDVEMFVKRT